MHTSASHAETALDSPSPPLGGREGGGEVGRSRFRTAAPPTSPSPSLTRWVPSLSPRQRAERANFVGAQEPAEMCEYLGPPAGEGRVGAKLGDGGSAAREGEG